MSKSKTKASEPKAEVLKRQYYFPTEGVSIEAATRDEASEKLKNQKKDQEVGDDRS